MYAIDSLDDVSIETTDLAHLLRATHDILHDLSRDRMTVADRDQVDRVHALVRIALERTERLNEEISTHFQKIRGAE